MNCLVLQIITFIIKISYLSCLSAHAALEERLAPRKSQKPEIFTFAPTTQTPEVKTNAGDFGGGGGGGGGRGAGGEDANGKRRAKVTNTSNGKKGNLKGGRELEEDAIAVSTSSELRKM